MSQWRGRFDDVDFDSPAELLANWYHVPTLAALIALMFYLRARTWSNFVLDGEVLFSGNDAWYHLRQTSYTVANWPNTMPFDPWTNFPQGTTSSQFGTLWDQLMATAALAVGLGSPSEQTVAMTVLFAPAVLGALTAIPVYLAGRRLGGKVGGIVGVLILALQTGGFLQRSMVGFSDHHVAEAFFQMTAVLGVMVALGVATREKPVWELVTTREWESIRETTGWSALAGVAIALYIWVWPPAVLLLGILGVFFIVQMCITYVKGRSPEHVGFAGVITLGVAGLLSLVPFNSVGISALDFSLLQPLAAFGVAFGCVFMAWLAREWDDRGLEPIWYPGAVFGTIAAGALVVAVVTPDLFDFFLDNLLRIVGGATGIRAGTVGEAQPLRQPLVALFSRYGLTYISAAVALLFIVVKQWRSDEPNPELTLLVVWGVVLMMATLTQARFDYYLVLPIVVANALIVGIVKTYIAPDAIDNIEPFQILTILTVILIIVAPLFVSITRAPSTPFERTASNAPSNGVVGWGDSMTWMETETPAVGTLGGGDERLEYFGTFERREDFEYRAGSYGVMSWWDYGHWITARGERIPVANPFQQNAGTAANYLLAPNETYAEDVRQEVSDPQAETRYVVVDWKMSSTWTQVNGKFFAPIRFTSLENDQQRDYYWRVFSSQGQQQYVLRTQRYYESMVNRLWWFHGSAASPQPVVVDYQERTLQDGRTARFAPQNGQAIRTFRNMSAAREFVREDGTAQVGGIGPIPSERIPALEHYRLVYNSQIPAAQRRSGYLLAVQTEARGLGLTSQRQLGLLIPSRNPPWNKVFERVPGATIEGTGPPNANVTASVEMRAPTTNTTFTYRQRAETGPNGEFTMTVPYSTTGYDQFGPENGHTNVSVRATGPYQFSAPLQSNESGYIYGFSGSAEVSEGQVLGEDDSAVEVELERTVFAEPQNQGNATDGNESSGQSRVDSPSSATGGALEPLATTPGDRLLAGERIARQVEAGG